MTHPSPKHNPRVISATSTRYPRAITISKEATHPCHNLEPIDISNLVPYLGTNLQPSPPQLPFSKLLKPPPSPKSTVVILKNTRSMLLLPTTPLPHRFA